MHGCMIIFMKKVLHELIRYGNYHAVWTTELKTLCELNYVCVGSITMLMTLIAVALAVSGGLYVGTIAFSAYKFAELDKAIALFQKADFINLA